MNTIVLPTLNKQSLSLYEHPRMEGVKCKHPCGHSLCTTLVVNCDNCGLAYVRHADYIGYNHESHLVKTALPEIKKARYMLPVFTAHDGHEHDP